MAHLHSVAPKELIQADYEVLKSYERLLTTPEIEDLLLMQSLEGRAHNGAGVFNKRTFVNTTIEDVVRALGRDPAAVKAARQVLIDEIFDFTRAVIDGEKRERLLNPAGRPFVGVPIFTDRRVNARDVLRGLYLGGLRDNPDVRKKAEDIYRIRIGGGRCYIVDIATMLEMNLDGESLAHASYEDKIEDFKHRGLIASVEGEVDHRSQRYFYIRHRVGPGQSDDAAFIMAGVLFNSDVALGVFLADAIDTLEKYAPVFKDQDGNLAYSISRGFKELRLGEEDVYELASLCAIPEADEANVPDSSLRYLLATDPRSGGYALKNHLDFIEGRPVANLPVSFKRIGSADFYEYINRRLLNVQKLEKLAVPSFTVKELERPVMEIARKDFATVPKDSTLADAVRKFKETKCEIILVQDKNSRVVGTVSQLDLQRVLGDVE